MSRGTVFINDEAAYEAAIARNIRANARKGREARWFAENPEREAMVRRLSLEAYDCPGSFLAKMYENYEEWGTLTAGQEAAVIKIFSQNDERKAAWKAGIMATLTFC